MNNKISNGMKYLKKNLFKFILVAFILVLPVLSLAQNTGSGKLGGNTGSGNLGNSSSTTIKNPIQADTVSGLIKTILEGVIKIGFPVIALAIIYCGFLFVSAQGNPEKIGDAKRALTYTLIGAAILLGSWAIAQLITETVLAL